MTNQKNEISRFARNDGSCRRWWVEGGGEAAPFNPMTLYNECHFERSEKSRSKAFYDLNSFTFIRIVLKMGTNSLYNFGQQVVV